jgi:hypothetical protein
VHELCHGPRKASCAADVMTIQLPENSLRSNVALGSAAGQCGANKEIVSAGFLTGGLTLQQLLKGQGRAQGCLHGQHPRPQVPRQHSWEWT